MSYPANTSAGEVVQIVEKRVESGMELFLSECGRTFTRFGSDLHTLVEVATKAEGEALSEIADAAEPVVEDLKDGLVEAATDAIDEITGSAPEEPVDPAPLDDAA